MRAKVCSGVESMGEVVNADCGTCRHHAARLAFAHLASSTEPNCNHGSASTEDLGPFGLVDPLVMAGQDDHLVLLLANNAQRIAAAADHF